MPPVIRSDRAEADLAEILAYLSGHSRGAAERLVRGLTEKSRLLEQLPEMGRPRDDLAPGLRSVVVEKYVIFYQPTPDAVVIVRILHGSRDIDSLFHDP